MDLLRDHFVLIVIAILCIASMITNIFTKRCGYVTKSKIHTPDSTMEGYSPMPSEHDFSANNIWDPLWEGEINVDCYSLNKDTCNNYASCGLCMKDGQWKCIPGDQDGGLFKEKCYRSTYTNYQERGMFGEKSTRIFAPTDYFYPLRYDTRWPSPTSRSTLFY